VNLSAIRRDTMLGQALRWPLRLLPQDLVVPVLQGRLRGKKWIVGSGVHGYWVGSYEWDKRRIFEQSVPDGGVVFDIGANVGFYTLLASQLVGPAGRVFAFEPSPRNLRYLHAHLALNRATNVSVIEAAVWATPGRVQFDSGADHSQGRVSPNQGLFVPAVVLDDLLTRGQIPLPDLIKMDIEGGELQALKGARSLLTQARPRIFLATHGAAIHHECCILLRELGYQFAPIQAQQDVGLADELMAWKAA
jgi:FkbM family methyltransferase